MKRLAAVFLTAAALSAAGSLAHAAPACDADNGGIKLPEGFCAKVIADDLKGGRHIVVAVNGDLYVSRQNTGRRTNGTPGGVTALRDVNGDGTYSMRETITTGTATGIALHNGYLYVAHPTSVERFKMTPGTLKATGPSETVVTGLPTEEEHKDKGIAFDGKGHLYVNVGSPSNACQPENQDRQKGVPGIKPCPILEKHGGIWQFDENKLNQTQDQGVKYATGMRQEPAITWFDGSLYVAMNSRDQLDTLWPEHFTTEDNANRPAEPLYKVSKGNNFGWPFCFYDLKNNKDIVNPEYGGDGTNAGDCAHYDQPVAVYPAHWAPVDIQFYTGSQFPAHYRDGAFIAFHGSWNRAPLPQDGYNVVYQPFKNGKPSGKYEIFATGFAGDKPLVGGVSASYRPDGVGQAPDGSIFIVDSEKGRVWHVVYNGGTTKRAMDPRLTHGVPTNVY